MSEGCQPGTCYATRFSLCLLHPSRAAIFSCVPSPGWSVAVLRYRHIIYGLSAPTKVPSTSLYSLLCCRTSQSSSMYFVCFILRSMSLGYFFKPRRTQKQQGLVLAMRFCFTKYLSNLLFNRPHVHRPSVLRCTSSYAEPTPGRSGRGGGRQRGGQRGREWGEGINLYSSQKHILQTYRCHGAHRPFFEGGDSST